MPLITENPPHVHFGAVYFRRSNPPREDWERDYAVAAEDGHTLFRHWLPWGAIEVAPGEYDLSDYDRHLDLAAKHGIRTVLAEIIHDVPEWLYHRYPHARREMADGRRRRSEMHISCATGGHNAMCLDNPEVADAAGAFLRTLARRYRGHPALYAYDVWNECTFYRPELICYCEATQGRFRDWLKTKYGTPQNVAQAWLRYSYTDWEQIELPRQIKPYPDVMDAIAFQMDNAIRQLDWRVAQIRSEDPDVIIAAHGNARTHKDAAPACGDDWRAGERVDLFGYTYWYGNDCDPVFAGDMVRSASRGRQFWRAEAIGDSDWLDRKIGDPLAARADEMHEPENIRLDCLSSFMIGARAFQNPRWRALLDGPLFGGFGWYGMDGERTERSAMIAGLARWANRDEMADLWRSRPVVGEAAILMVDEAQAHIYAMHGDTRHYSLAFQGAAEAFMAINVQADIIKIDQIDAYRLIYVPLSLGVSHQTIERLSAWVAGGGTLVVEAGFGYLDEKAHAYPKQPSRGLDALLGARETFINLGVDRWEQLDIQTDHGAVPGGLHRQSFELAGGRASAHFDDGTIAGVDHAFGAGRTRIIGSMPSYGFKRRPSDAGRRWFRGLLDLAKVEPRVSQGPNGVLSRLSQSESQTFLWVRNSETSPRASSLTVPELPLETTVRVLRGDPVERYGNELQLTVPGRDVTILAWEHTA